jgi:hypothetical protein
MVIILTKFVFLVNSIISPYIPQVLCYFFQNSYLIVNNVDIDVMSMIMTCDPSFFHYYSLFSSLSNTLTFYASRLSDWKRMNNEIG